MKTTIEGLRSEGKTVKEVCAQLNITKGEYYKIIKAVEETAVPEIKINEVEVLDDPTDEEIPLPTPDEDVAPAPVKTSKTKKEKAVKEPKVKEPTKSDSFIAMYEAGKTISEIAKETNSQYSFVYGVIDKRIGLTRQPKAERSDAIRDLAAQGKTPGQIAKELNANYSFVHTVVKKYKATLAVAQ